MAGGEIDLTPGYIFANANDPVDTTKLNLLGNPIAHMADGSVTATQLAAEINALIATAVANAATALAAKQPKNLLINGSFDIWQRGTTFNADVGVDPFAVSQVADRWVTTAHNANRTILQAAFGSGQTAVPGNPIYALRWSQAGPVTVNPTYLAQRVERVSTIENGPATVSMWVRPDAAFSIGLQLVQHFGAGSNSPSADFGLPVQGFALVTSQWQKITATFALPSILGKIIGDNPAKGDWLELRINAPTGTAFTLDVAQVQLEAGTTASTFDRRRVEEELNRCQRYYEVSLRDLSSAFTNVRPMWDYKVTKRTTVNPTTLDVIGDTGPFPAYFTGVDMGGAYQTTVHGQTFGTFAVDAELVR